MPYSAAVEGAAVEHVARQCISCATAEAAAHEAASLLLVPVQHGIRLSLAGCLMHVRSRHGMFLLSSGAVLKIHSSSAQCAQCNAHLHQPPFLAFSVVMHVPACLVPVALLLQGDVLLWHKENGLETLEAVQYIEMLEGEVARLRQQLVQQDQPALQQRQQQLPQGQAWEQQQPRSAGQADGRQLPVPVNSISSSLQQVGLSGIRWLHVSYSMQSQFQRPPPLDRPMSPRAFQSAAQQCAVRCNTRCVLSNTPHQLPAWCAQAACCAVLSGRFCSQ